LLSVHCEVFWVLYRNLTRPTILAGFILIAERDPAAVVAVEMWEPALCAGFQAPGVRVGNSRLGVATDPRRVISIAKPRIPPIFGKSSRRPVPKTGNLAFQKAA
jgi:hypothetical protein